MVHRSKALSLLGAGARSLQTCHILIDSSFGQTVKILSPLGLKQLWDTACVCAFVSVINCLHDGYSWTVIEFVRGVLVYVSLGWDREVAPDGVRFWVVDRRGVKDEP